jgi:hypothetical protein
MAAQDRSGTMLIHLVDQRPSLVRKLLQLGPGRPRVTRADVDSGGRKLGRAGVTARVLKHQCLAGNLPSPHLI